MIKKNILLIGAGEIGSRHLQALMLLGEECNITVIDPSQKSLDTAKQRALQVNSSEENNVFYTQSLSAIKVKEFDCTIIATSAAHRYAVLESLIEIAKTRHIIFEKILFQELDKYSKTSELLEINEIKGWVNCPMRIFPLYENFKNNYIKGNKIVHISVHGGENNGLACNSIHYIDLMNFLNNEYLEEVDTNLLDGSYIPSKRSGNIEFTGKIKYIFSKGSTLTYESKRAKVLDNLVLIKHGNITLKINENKNIAEIYMDEKFLERIENAMPYQSNLTNIIVNNLINFEECNLSEFSLSSKLHVKLIESLLNFFNKINNTKDKKLQIT